jgi:hypothetical protein
MRFNAVKTEKIGLGLRLCAGISEEVGSNLLQDVGYPE